MTISIRPTSIDDLDAINLVIEAAVMNWHLPERVKRLSLPSYRYTEIDLKHLDMVVAENFADEIIGIAAWEEADPEDLPDKRTTMLLHGIYVHPEHQHQGIGQQLFHYVESNVQQQASGLLVKAQADAKGFFLAQGMHALSIENDKSEYANRFWKIFAN